jgi:glucokinase
MRHAAGIDLGGTELRVGLVDETGRVLRLERMATDVAAAPVEVIDAMAVLVRRVADGRAAPEAIGICTPGPLDAAGGRVLAPPTLPRWRDVALCDLLAERTGLSVTLENDGHAAALGEWRHGAGRTCDDFVYVTVSTGIGGGIVSGGRLLRGVAGLAAHVGHMTVSDTSEPCACGNRGCWEALASGTALARRARAALAASPGSLIGTLAGTEAATARHVAEAARAGDALAVALLAGEARWLGIGIVNLLHLVSPRLVLVGGGVSACFDLLEPGIREEVAQRALPAFRGVEIRRAELGSTAGLVGVASLAMDAQLSKSSPSLDHFA